MTMTRRAALAAAICLMAAPAALAQSDYPGSKVVTIVVPFAAGGTTDLLGRVLADRLGARLGGKFIVENRPVPAATPAWPRRAVDARRLHPDHGHGLDHAINPAVYAKMPFDHIKDFAPISQWRACPTS